MNNNASIELSTDWCVSGSKSAKCTAQASNGYAGYGANSPSVLIGSTIHTTIDYKALSNCVFRIMYQLNGTWAYAKNISVNEGVGKIDTSANIPSGATGVRIRFTDFTNGNGSVIYLDNFTIYLS